MSYYDTTNVRELYSHRIWKQGIAALFHLNKHEPLALPYYACLDSMVKAKRRIMDNDYMKLRIANNKIELWIEVQGMARDNKDRDNYSHRRDLAKNGDINFYGEKLAFFEDLADGGKEYGIQLDPAVRNFTQRFDTWICGMSKLKYMPLPTEFEEHIGSCEKPIKTELQKLIPNVESISVNTTSSYATLGIKFEDNTDDDDDDEEEKMVSCDFTFYYKVVDATKKLTFGYYKLDAKERTGSYGALNQGHLMAPQVTNIVQTEIKKYFDKASEKNKKDIALIAKLDTEEKAFAKEATTLYEKLYKASVEEISGAQTLGIIT